jgi:hypothetical protein
MEDWEVDKTLAKITAAYAGIPGYKQPKARPLGAVKKGNMRLYCDKCARAWDVPQNDKKIKYSCVCGSSFFGITQERPAVGTIYYECKHCSAGIRHYASDNCALCPACRTVHSYVASYMQNNKSYIIWGTTPSGSSGTSNAVTVGSGDPEHTLAFDFADESPAKGCSCPLDRLMVEGCKCGEMLKDRAKLINKGWVKDGGERL